MAHDFYEFATIKSMNNHLVVEGIVMRLVRLLSVAVLGMLVAAPMAMAQQRGTQDQAKALSEKAAAHVKDVGADKAIADFNDPAGGYQDHDLFVVVYDRDGKIVCGPGVPGLVNHDAKVLKDADGKEFGKEILNATSGTWVEYRMTNPTIKKIEKKASYVNKIGEYTVFVGAYVL